MKRCLWKLLIPLMCMLLACGGAVSQQRELKTDQNEKVDAILLLDGSGSMRITDPLKLRDEGARLFSQFLKAGDRLGVIGFSTDAQVIRPLSDYDSSQGAAIGADIARVGDSGLHTDLLTGIRAGKSMMDQQGRKDARKVIILLSDGKMEPDPARTSAAAATEQLLKEVLPELKSSEVKIHTLSFSDKADKELLAEIAAGTEGTSMYTPDADTVHQSFANLFLIVKKPQIVPLTSRGFKIDGDVQEATFYINREENAEFSIESPDGDKISFEKRPSDVKWFRGQKFDVITIIAPKVGEWRLNGMTSPDAFATVLTNLKLATDWPTSINSGDKELLQARLYEAEKPVDLPEMADVIKFAYQIIPTDKVSEPIVREFLSDDGKNGDKIARDGIFSAQVQIDEPGEYKLTVLSRAPTFERSQQIPFRIKPRLVTLRVEKREHGAGGHGAHGAEGHGAHGDGHADSHDDNHGSGHGGGHGGGAAKTGHDEHAEEGDHGDHGADPHAGSHDDHKAGEHHEGGAEDGDDHDGGSHDDDANDVFVIELSNEALSFKKVEVKLTAVDANRKRYNIPLEKSLKNPLIYEAPAAALPAEGKFLLQATITATVGKKSVKASSESIEYSRKAVAHAEAEAEVVVVVKEPEKKHDAKEPFLLPLIVMSLITLGVGVAMVVMSKKGGMGPSVHVPEFAPVDPYLKIIEELNSKIAQSELDLTDPLFTSAGPSRSEASSEIPEAASEEPAPDDSEEAGA